jgi:hypothetical protein
MICAAVLAAMVAAAAGPVVTGRALDEGADPATAAQRITEAAKKERTAVSDLQVATATAPAQFTVDDVLATIEKLGSLAGVLSTADPSDRRSFTEAECADARQAEASMGQFAIDA